MMAMHRPMTLNHLYLRVADLAASEAFYRRYFGFTGPPEWQGETCVIRDEAGFTLALTPDPAPPAWPDGLHYGFVLDSVADARRLLARFQRDAHPVHESYLEPAFVVFKVRDPDGYLVEVEAGVPTFPPA
jgi:catechol 2,3-dioxygenase-like lactoylglutathione lyase family enzyme